MPQEVEAAQRPHVRQLDSFDVVTLVSILDKTYGIAIDGVDIVPENFKNVQTIETLLHKNGVTP